MNGCHLPREKLISLRRSQVRELGSPSTGATNPKDLQWVSLEGAVGTAHVEGTCGLKGTGTLIVGEGRHYS